MKAILFLGMEEQGGSRDALRAAARMGYAVHVLTTNPTLFRDADAALPEAASVQYVRPLRFRDGEAEIERLRSAGVDVAAVVSFSERHVYTACLLNDAIRGEVFTTAAYRCIRNKAAVRKRLEGLPFNPYYAILTDNHPSALGELEARLPLILKRPNSGGSRDVYLAADAAELSRAAQRLSPSKEAPALVEEYLDGPQYLTEVLVYGGSVRLVAVIRQDVEFENGKFIVKGYSIMRDRAAPLFLALEETVNAVIERIGLKNGSCHLELRCVRGNWKLVEINSRLSGGFMNRFIDAATGVDTAEAIVRMWLGGAPDVRPTRDRYAYARYVTADRAGRCRAVRGVEEARQAPGVELAFVHDVVGQPIRPPRSMADRYGCVIAVGDSAEEAEANAKAAAAMIRFEWERP